MYSVTDRYRDLGRCPVARRFQGSRYWENDVAHQRRHHLSYVRAHYETHCKSQHSTFSDESFELLPYPLRGRGWRRGRLGREKRRDLLQLFENLLIGF